MLVVSAFDFIIDFRVLVNLIHVLLGVISCIVEAILLDVELVLIVEVRLLVMHVRSSAAAIVTRRTISHDFLAGVLT